MALIRDLFGLEVETSSEARSSGDSNAEPLAEVRELRPRN
jgi:hypothetical protein